ADHCARLPRRQLPPMRAARRVADGVDPPVAGAQPGRELQEPCIVAAAADARPVQMQRVQYGHPLLGDENMGNVEPLRLSPCIYDDADALAARLDLGDPRPCP